MISGIVDAGIVFNQKLDLTKPGIEYSQALIPGTSIASSRTRYRIFPGTLCVVPGVDLQTSYQVFSTQVSFFSTYRVFVFNQLSCIYRVPDTWCKVSGSTWHQVSSTQVSFLTRYRTWPIWTWPISGTRYQGVSWKKKEVWNVERGT